MIYNELRPMDLSEVEGQEVVVSTLRSQFKSGKIAHSYLNLGTRGTGKTTIARIISRAVNCLHPTENGPCNCCENCRQILKGNSMDIMEIDAATNNGVDDVRALRGFFDTVALMKFKVLIIDEMHMLSNAAMNALLKVVEEPPVNLIFIFCTTEIHKVPATIVSRCMKLFFKTIDEETIATKLSSACEKYQKEYELAALYQIARAADGSMRDALSLLEACFGSEKISTEGVRENLGTVNEELILQISAGVTSNDGKSVFATINDVADTGRSMSLMVNDVISVFTDIIIFHQAGLDSIINNDWYKESLASIAKNTTQDLMFMAISQLSDLKNEMRKESNPKILVTTVFFKIMRDMQKQEEFTVLQSKVDSLEREVITLKETGCVGNKSVITESVGEMQENMVESYSMACEEVHVSSNVEASQITERGNDGFSDLSDEEPPFDMSETYDEEDHEACEDDAMTFTQMKEQELNETKGPAKETKESASTPINQGMFGMLYKRTRATSQRN